MTAPRQDPDALLRQLQAIAPADRLDFLANLPSDQQAAFRRILSRDDIQKLNRHIDVLVQKRRTPTYESWLADARDGRATSPDAMIDVLREVFDKLRPQDAEWIRRIEATASASGYSKRQAAVISGIYAKYFVQRPG